MIKKLALVLGVFICLILYVMCSNSPSAHIVFKSGDQSLQSVIDAAPPGCTIVCDAKDQLEFDTPVVIKKAMTLKGLNARLPEGLGRTSLIQVMAEGVTLCDLELHGNYDSVPQNRRAPLISICKGNFRVERCKFYDATKEGVSICPDREGSDIVGGIIRDIEAFRIGRDAVSISGGKQGLRVCDVTVENVSLKTGYLKGAVEVSDGADNIRVRGVYAEDCPYAVDVQDHLDESAAPNTNVVIEDVTAVRCRYIIRTENSPRGHAYLTVRHCTGRDCEEPIFVSNTKEVHIEDLKILEHRSDQPPISLTNCHGVILKDVIIESAEFTDQPVQSMECTDVKIETLKTTRLTAID